jgi:hypothetical protein
MFNAYSVAVKVRLLDQVTGGLLAMSKQFNLVNGNAVKLQAQLDKIKLMGMAGAGLGAAGFMGLGVIGKMIKPAEEYVHQLNIMNMAGLKHVDMANAIGDAWKNTGTVITTTATENLRSILDLRNVLGNMEEARMALPIVSRIQAVLAASSEGQISGNSKELSYSMAKALDIIGAAQDKQSFERQAEMMAKVIIATQGRVTPEAFKSTFQYARQAKYRLDDEFKYEILPSLIQENAAGGGGGGGSRGVGPMLAAFYRWSNQGYINKKSLPELISLGLVAPGTALHTTTQGTTVGAMRGGDLAAANPFQWVQEVLVPAIKRKYGQNLSRDQLMMHINEISRGNQLAGNLVGEFAFKPVNFTRDQANIRGTMSTTEAYKAALSNDPNTARKALAAQWENFKTAFTMGVVPVLIPALIKLTEAFNSMANWARENPGLAKGIALGFTAIFGAMAMGGTVLMMAAAFKGLGLALSLFGTGGMAGSIMAIGRAILGLSATVMTNPYVLTLLATYGAYKAGGGIVDWADKKMAPKGFSSVADWWVSGDKDKHTAEFDKFKKKYDAQKAGDIYMDGKKVGEIVSAHQAREAGRPTGGTASFDGSMSPRPVGASGGW